METQRPDPILWVLSSDLNWIQFCFINDDSVVSGSDTRVHGNVLDLPLPPFSRISPNPRSTSEDGRSHNTGGGAAAEYTIVGLHLSLVVFAFLTLHFIRAPRPHEVRWLGANRPGCSQVGYLATPSRLHLGGRVPSTLAPAPAPVSSTTRSRCGASAAEHTTALSGMRWVVY